MATVKYGTGALGLLKRGWNELPDIMFGSFMALLGIGMGCAGCYLYVKNDGDKRKHKLDYIVMRPDDPRVKNIPK